MSNERIMEAAFRSRPEHEKKSPIFKLLWDQYEAYQGKIGKHGRTDWEHMAATMAEEGVMDGNGNPPTGPVVRATFAKVRRLKENTRPKPGKAVKKIRRVFGRNAGR